MPFGLCNTPAMFQRLMQNSLGEVNLTYCLIYLDDVIIFSKTEEGHLHHLCIVFECLRAQSEAQAKNEINYLVHHVSKEGVQPSKENMKAAAKFALPQTYTEIRAFLGLVGHYWQFSKALS